MSCHKNTKISFNSNHKDINYYYINYLVIAIYYDKNYVKHTIIMKYYE